SDGRKVEGVDATILFLIPRYVGSAPVVLQAVRIVPRPAVEGDRASAVAGAADQRVIRGAANQSVAGCVSRNEQVVPFAAAINLGVGAFRGNCDGVVRRNCVVADSCHQRYTAGGAADNLILAFAASDLLDALDNVDAVVGVVAETGCRRLATSHRC